MNNKLLISLTSALLTVSTGVVRAAEEKPNVIVIFTDDQGYNDLGCFGSKTIKTPNLDNLANEGMKLTSFMVASPVCSPSRAALLAASYPKRVSMHKGVLFPHSTTGLNPSEYTIADHFKSHGYATACVGKWHLGHHKETLPTSNGFDSYFGIPYSNDMNHPDNKNKPSLSVKAQDKAWLDMEESVKGWKTPLMRNEKIIEVGVDQRMITKRYSDESIKFIKANKEKPFFLYLAESMPHIPLFVPDENYDRDPKNAYKSVIEHIDQQIGRVIQTLKDEGLDKKTIIVFTSDNGPWLKFKHFAGSAAPLRDGKGTTYDGGQRVPCIVWAPGRIKAGGVSDDLASTMDLLPTLAALTQTKIKSKNKIDGIDISSTILGGDGPKRNEFLYFNGWSGQLEAIRQGEWKLRVNRNMKHGKKNQGNKVISPIIELYNLKDDISESKNLAKQHPEIVKKLRKRMTALDAEISANMRPIWKK